MICDHLRQLYDHCQKHDIKLSSSDAIKILCKECQKTDVCPAVMTDEFEDREANATTSTQIAPPPGSDEHSAP